MSKKTGTREWSDISFNIQTGCEHGCRYCYARYDAVCRWKRVTAEQWEDPFPIYTQRLAKRHRKFNGTIMFPTTHDITPRNVAGYMRVLGDLLKFENQVLIVSKPDWQCISMICDSFRKYRDQIIFRFTIGSTSDRVLKFWEPGAPGFAERLCCLKYAFFCGYKTSVSCEPYLGAFVPQLYDVCKEFINDSFWIGKLRHWNSRVRLDDATPEQIDKYVLPLKKAQSDTVVKSMFKALEGKPFIEWKDSIKKVVAK